MIVTFAVGLCAGIFAAILVLIDGYLGLASWLGFVAMLSYYATEGGKDGFMRSTFGNISGLAWGWVILALNTVLAGIPAPWGLAVIVIPVVVVMCLQSKWKLLSYTPGVFAGCSMLFAMLGAGDGIDGPSLYTKMFKVLIAIVVGNIGALASQQIGVKWGTSMQKGAGETNKA
ncbi:DUF1097 domain-containing protein [Enterocloster bolteae]|uniref:DUF1097 domain-containing protein n=1 Tax=Enterocloster bolteae TaxID=208479 RepID=UPI002108B703|nr:DUF1097 domain-containing protein [Enterocloster bolteae]MCQ5144543.1 DUF1097 domain-containing protein [Enterocloster bolteae]